MNLRDYFASKVIVGIVATNFNGANLNRASEWSEAAYKIADVMLTERNKENV